MRDRSALTLALALALLAARPVSADDPPRARFSGNVQVVEVEVPVEVRNRDGEPVRDLTRDDFRLFDDGKQRPIERFEVIDLTASGGEGANDAPAETAPAAGSARDATTRPRHILLLFDLTFSNPIAVMRARTAAREVVLESLLASDLVGVATFSVELGPRMLVTFTPDRAQVARALDSLSFDRAAQYRLSDPLRFLAPFTPGATEDQGSRQTSESSELKQQLRDVVTENNAVLAERVELEARRYESARVAAWTRSLAELSRFLASIDGRKQVILFSEGFDSRLLLGRSDLSDPEEMQDNQNAESGQVWRVDNNIRFGNTELLGDANRLIEQLKRADCVLDAVDTGGLRAAEGAGIANRTRGREGLFYLANESGGELLEHGNDLAVQLRSALDRTSYTYLLTFRAEDVPEDGSWRRLRVELVRSRGLRVVTRPGWYAPRPFQEMHPFERDLLAADTIALAEPKKEIGLSVLATPFRATEELAYVPVILEIDGKSLLGGSAERREVDLYAYASNRGGEFKAFFHRELALDPGQGAEELAAGGIKYYGHFVLAADDYLVRVLVRDQLSGRIGAAAVPLRVPDYSRSQPTLIQPLFIDAPGRWSLVRERTESDASGSVVYPFVVGGEPFIPQAEPSFRPGERPRLCVGGYNLQGSELRLEAVWLDGADEVPFQLAAEALPTSSETYRQWLTHLDLDGLSAGEHRFRLEVVDAASGQALATTIASLRIES